jgi:hypothetical protein
MDQRRRRRGSDAQLRPRAAMARSRLGAQRHTHGRALSRLRTRLLRRPHAPALGELHKAHHSAEVLTPLVNFRIHPLDSLILSNNLALFIGVIGDVIGGAAQYALGRKAVSFDQNVLMLLYIYWTAQLQQSEIWIPFHRPLGANVHEPGAPPAAPLGQPSAFQLHGRKPGDLGLARGQLAHALRRGAWPCLRRFRAKA